ncbi:MAG: hypothetical protein AAF368_12375 [Planctomycetota bacterium]
MPALPFLLVIAGTYLCVVDGVISGLETIAGTELPSPRDFFRQNTTGEHRNGHIGGTSIYCDLCWDRSNGVSRWARKTALAQRVISPTD